MDMKLQGFWEGRASAMAAARKKARELIANSKWFEAQRSEAESILASAHYSRATTLRTRGRQWLPLVAWHFWRARAHAHGLFAYDTDGLYNFSPDQLDVVATIFRKGPFPDLRRARLCLAVAIGKIAGRNKIVPHTAALLWIGLGECCEQCGDTGDVVGRYFQTAADLIPQIEAEEPDISGKRQLVRVLKHCGAYFKRIGDARGDEFLARAKKLAEEVSSDQVAKIKAMG